jgi:hypothetical protein
MLPTLSSHQLPVATSSTWCPASISVAFRLSDSVHATHLSCAPMFRQRASCARGVRRLYRLKRNGAIFGTAELYDPASGRFRPPAGSMITLRVGHGATLLADGRVLLEGGWDTGGTLASAELYDPGSNVFRPTGAMASRRGDFTSTLLADGKVLVAGGEDRSALTTAELYDPRTPVEYRDLRSTTRYLRGHRRHACSALQVPVCAGPPRQRPAPGCRRGRTARDSTIPSVARSWPRPATSPRRGITRPQLA